jgi:hypothetical protein
VEGPLHTDEAEDELDWVVIHQAGFMPFVFISPERQRRSRKAQQEHEARQQEKKNKPPEPPSRPNARVHLGNVALGHS